MTMLRRAVHPGEILKDELEVRGERSIADEFCQETLCDRSSGNI